MPTIPLTRGQVAQVSRQDFEFLSRWTWFALWCKDRWYAARKEFGAVVLMHRVVLNAAALEKIDHKDGDGLNNRRGNLRRCTLSQNCANSKRRSDNKSGYKGVSWKRDCGKWQVSLQQDRKNRYIGIFSSAKEAARAYDRAALSAFGPFAKLNFI